MYEAQIGIITILYAENYGAVLQCYALKEKLKEIYGENVSVVDYCSPNDKIGYGIFLNNLFKQHKWKSYLLYLLKLPFNLKNKILRKKIFRIFREEKICPLICNEYGLLIYGSDQIWAYSSILGGYNPIFWGEKYKSSMKISYAASMGKITHIDDDYVRTHLRNFNHLSVREENLKLLLEELGRKDVVVSLDPTLLLSSEKWGVFCNEGKKVRRNYILVYNLNNVDLVMSIANKIAKETSLEIIEILGHTHVFESSNRKSTFSPQEFVSLFKNASFVVTSSFHGTVFSLIFHKNFWVSQDQNSKRVESLLSSLGYVDRFVINNNINVLQPIDYSSFETKLNELKKSSEIFLKSAINDFVK